MTSLFGGKYKGCKVLVTGHTGFKGSWLTLWLRAMGADVLGYSLPAPTTPSHYNLLNITAEEVIADICDYDELLQTFTDYRPDLVFHLAAQPLVRASYNNPLETFNSNVMGTANVLNAIKETGSVRAGVFITTDKCYEPNTSHVGYKETDRLGGHAPYGVSKACSEMVIASYRESFFGNPDSCLIASCRAGNVIGGGDWAEDRLIPDLVASAISATPAHIRYPQAVRPWQHVLEPLAGYLLLGKYLLEGREEFATAWNFGPDEAECVAVGEVINAAQKNWGKISVEYGTHDGVTEDINLTLDSSKASSQLEWKPVWSSIEDTVEKTIEWYKAYYEEKRVISIEQLDEFVRVAGSKKLVWTC